MPRALWIQTLVRGRISPNPPTGFWDGLEVEYANSTWP